MLKGRWHIWLWKMGEVAETDLWCSLCSSALIPVVFFFLSSFWRTLTFTRFVCHGVIVSGKTEKVRGGSAETCGTRLLVCVCVSVNSIFSKIWPYPKPIQSVIDERHPEALKQASSSIWEVMNTLTAQSQIIHLIANTDMWSINTWMKMSRISIVLVKWQTRDLDYKFMLTIIIICCLQ